MNLVRKLYWWLSHQDLGSFAIWCNDHHSSRCWGLLTSNLQRGCHQERSSGLGHHLIWANAQSSRYQWWENHYHLKWKYSKQSERRTRSSSGTLAGQGRIKSQSEQTQSQGCQWYRPCHLLLSPWPKKIYCEKMYCGPKGVVYLLTETG